MQYFFRLRSSWQTFEISICYIMLKTGFVQFIFINIIGIPCCFEFFYSCFVFLNSLQAIQINRSCLRCVSSIDLCQANKNLLIMFFFMYTQNKMSHLLGDYSLYLTPRSSNSQFFQQFAELLFNNPTTTLSSYYQPLGLLGFSALQAI